MTTREPLLLLHGLMMSAGVWADVVPLLTGRHDVIAHTAAGHRGGSRLDGTATVAALTDEVERMLDARKLGRVHVAGNSMGGWMAIELARRGRALTVCAFSPAGFWIPGARRDPGQPHGSPHETSGSVGVAAGAGAAPISTPSATGDARRRRTR